MHKFTMYERSSREMCLSAELYTSVNQFVEISVHERFCNSFAESFQISISELDELIDNLTKMRAEVKE